MALVSRRVKSPRADAGMTIVEVVVSMMLFTIFSAIFLMVSEFTTRYLGESEASLVGSQGLLVDHHRLQVAMDGLSESLSYPAVTREKIVTVMTNPEQSCTYDPIFEWGLTGKRPELPPGYKICLKSTSLSESTIDALVQQEASAKAGIYVLLAVPDEVTASARPVRRLFCRPKPYC
jgi:hypothetical protein